MKIEKYLKICMAVGCILLFASCGKQENGHIKKTNAVDKVLNEQMSKEDGRDGTSDEVISGETEKFSENTNAGMSGSIIPSGEGVDYDLTAMSGDMVYATVYQLMMDPKTYVGKTFRIKGTYYSAYVEETGKRYFYCIVSDATACCAQGLEFVWGDGSHSYPDEYPQEESTIIVEGTFDTYREKEDSIVSYCRLSDAAIVVE